MRNTVSSMPTLGQHLIIDIWGAQRLDDITYIEDAMLAMTSAAGATLIKTFFHCFGPDAGITGVAILAESHISIHTWPEHSYAAFDIFMCGKANVQKALVVLKELFSPTKCEVTFLSRGQLATTNNLPPKAAELIN